MNKVRKVISKEGVLCFVIQTEGDNDFWYWEISWDSWEKYWENKCNTCLVGNVMEWAANEFVNAEENSALGCSCGSFLTIEDAVFDYLEIKAVTY